MALPYGTTGSLCSSFLPDRLVGLSVKHPCAITLSDRLPIGLRVPLEASVTLLEATTPVKLPTKQCPRSCELALKHSKVRISTAAPRRLASPTRSLRTILPDKEFRYLRTVIVTAAVYRGFNSSLLLRLALLLTFRHRAGVRLYTSS